MKYSSNSAAFAQGIKKSRDEKVKKLRFMIVSSARFVHKSLIDKTPVWEGQTVRNYIMTLNAPFVGEYAASGGGDTGRTNSMALGAEPRRGVNAAAALQSGSVLNEDNCFTHIFITNNSEAVMGLELGLLPGAGYKPRSPQGMFGITMQELMNRLKSKQL